MLMFRPLLLSFYISLAFCDLNITDKISQLIVTSESWFSKDADALSPRDFTIFLQKDNSSTGDTNVGTIYISEENPEITLRNKHVDYGDPLIILNKGEDGLHPSQKFTYIVLRQVITSPKHYSAHLAYVREIDGKDEIEWDNYNPSIKRENTNFVAAFIPYDSKLDSLVRTANAPPAKQHIGSLTNSDLDPFTLFDNENITEIAKAADTKNAPFFSQLEESLVQEAANFQSPTNTSSSNLTGDNTKSGAIATITERRDDARYLRIRLKCPPNSGAILIKRNCFCPKGTKKLKKKCVELSKLEQRENLTSEENDEQTNNETSSLEVNAQCPRDSGLVLVGKECLCPEGTILKDKKCVQSQKISGENNSVDVQENGNRVVRDAVPTKTRAIVQAIEGIKTAKPAAPVAPKGRSLETQTTTPKPKVITDKDNTIGVARSFFNVGRVKIHLSAGDQSLKLSSAPGNNTQDPNYKFEDSTPFTGILTCTYERPKENSLLPKASIASIVEFYLSSLRAQCYQEIRVNTISLFEKRLVSVGNNSRVQLNSDHQLLKKRVFSITEWNDVISGILLSIYSDVYRDQIEKLKEKGNIGNTSSPDEKEISHSVYTLTLMVEKALKLLNKEMKYHSIKFINSLTSALNERLLKVFREKEQLLLDCYDCDKEQLILNQNEIQLRALLDFIRYSFVNVLNAGGQKTFAEYYLSTTTHTSQTSSQSGRAIAQGRSLAKSKGKA